MKYEAILHLLEQIPSDRRAVHPLGRLAAALDELGQRRARRVERAILKARQFFPEFAARKEELLVKDQDLNNEAAALGELRALSGLAQVFRKQRSNSRIRV